MPQLKQCGVQNWELLCQTRKAGGGWWRVTQLCPSLCDPMEYGPQAALSLGFSRQEHWSGLPCPPPGDLPNPEMEPASLMSPALAGGFFATSATWEAPQGKQSPAERRKTSSSRLARAQPMRDCHNSANEKSLCFQLSVPPIDSLFTTALRLPFLLFERVLCLLCGDCTVAQLGYRPHLQFFVDLK